MNKSNPMFPTSASDLVTNIEDVGNHNRSILLSEVMILEACLFRANMLCVFIDDAVRKGDLADDSPIAKARRSFGEPFSGEVVDEWAGRMQRSDEMAAIVKEMWPEVAVESNDG